MTPREFSYALDGYRTRDEREWAKCATIIAYCGWHKEATSPKKIFDAITGRADERDFEDLAGLSDSGSDFDAMVAKQAQRKS